MPDDDADEMLDVYRNSKRTAAQLVTPLPEGREPKPGEVLPAASVEPEKEDALPAAIGPHRVVALRGRGGMGIVYEARDDHLSRRIAIKVLLTGRFTDGRSRERFLREARTAGSLRHDHLVPVYSAETPDGGAPYIVMPFIEGPTLADIIQERRGLPPRLAAEYTRQIADGLAAVHAAGVIHRDVKPGNILIDAQDGRAKLTDFGLARSESGDSKTTAGTIAGTPNYLSPEQIRSPDTIDARADVYGLGASLYECLTGVPPFRGSTLDILRMIGEDDPVTVRRLRTDVSRDLETITLKCLEKNPARRYASAADLRDDLARFLNNEPIKARAANRVERSIRWLQRNPWAATVIAVSLLGTFVAGWGWLRAAEKEEQAKLAAAAANAAKVQADDARIRADKARQQADQQALLALNTITTLIGTSQSMAERVPGTLILRKALAEAALADLKKLTASVDNLPGAERTTINTHFKIGDAYRLLGQTKELRHHRQKGLELSAALVEANPDDAEALRLFGEAHWLLSVLDRLEGRRAEALAHAESAVAAHARARQLAPDDKLCERYHAVSLGARADVLAAEGHLDKALADLKASIVICNHLFDTTTEFSLILHDLSYTHSRIVTILCSQFEFQEASTHSAHAVVYAQKALELDLTNAERQRAARIAILDRANFLTMFGDYAAAETIARTGYGECEPAARLEPENKPLQRDLAIAHSLLGLALMGQDRFEAAAENFEKSLAIREKIGSSAAGDLTSILYLLLGAEVRRGQFDRAAKVCDRILAAIEANRKSPDPQAALALQHVDLLKRAYAAMPGVLAEPATLKKQPAELQPLLLSLLAMHDLYNGKPEAARATLVDALAATPNDPVLLMFGMIVHSRCATKAASPAEEEQMLKIAQDCAVKLAKKHPNRFPNIFDHPELLALREHPPFQELMRSFAKK